MAGIVHLYSDPVDFQTCRSIDLLTSVGLGTGRSLGVSDGVRVLQFTRDVRIVRNLIPSPSSIHAWGTRALVTAVAGFSGTIYYSPDGACGRSVIQFVRAVSRVRDIRVICPSQTLHRLHVQSGLSPDRCSVVYPGVDFARIHRRRDRALRQSLGFSESDVVIFCPGEATRSAAFDRSVWAGAILHRLDEKYRLLITGQGPTASACLAFGRGLKVPMLVTNPQEKLGGKVELETLLSACDMVLTTPAGVCPTLPLLTCMAAGLPVVSTVTYTGSEILEDRHNALLVGKPTPRLIARRVLDVLEDPHLQYRIADAARADVYEHFSKSRFIEGMSAIYNQTDITAVASGAHHSR